MAKIKFDNIKGYKEEKKELSNLCYIIKNQAELKKLGGKLPRGVFLLGPNGVGKTVLSNAFIEESGCPSVVVNYNDLDDEERFTSYIKKVFKEAASKAPCILFIDELDKLIGNDTKIFMQDNFDKSRILLNEINKYKDVEGLFILACGNKDFEVDYSVIRSGRIDKIIEINLPNQTERKEIIEYYAKGKKFAPNVDFKAVAKDTKGFSGADIESLLNNALIKSFTDKRDEITLEDILTEFYDKVFSSKSKKPILENESLKSIAVHEAGHAVVTLVLDKEGLTCVNVLSRQGVRGFSNTRFNEQTVKSLEDNKNLITIALAGLVAENLVLHSRNDGAKNDIQKARNIAKILVRNDGYFGLEYTDASFFGDDEMGHIMMGRTPQEKSEKLLEKLEELENKIIKDCETEAKKILDENKKLLNTIADNLMIKKILNREDIEKIVKSI